MQEEMMLLARWAKIEPEDYEKIFTREIEAIEAVYSNEFAMAKKVWDRLPEQQWETTKLLGRDLPEWADLKVVLINFRKALRKLYSKKKVKKQDVESQPEDVS
jgi:hypothetical protein